jgi:hypothetical protein
MYKDTLNNLIDSGQKCITLFRLATVNFLLLFNAKRDDKIRHFAFAVFNNN